MIVFKIYESLPRAICIRHLQLTDLYLSRTTVVRIQRTARSNGPRIISCRVYLLSDDAHKSSLQWSDYLPEEHRTMERSHHAGGNASALVL